MLETAIYCKTHKGAEEIATRAHHLASRLRSTPDPDRRTYAVE